MPLGECCPTFLCKGAASLMRAAFQATPPPAQPLPTCAGVCGAPAPPPVKHVILPCTHPHVLGCVGPPHHPQSSTQPHPAPTHAGGTRWIWSRSPPPQISRHRWGGPDPCVPGPSKPPLSLSQSTACVYGLLCCSHFLCWQRHRFGRPASQAHSSMVAGPTSSVHANPLAAVRLEGLPGAAAAAASGARMEVHVA